MGISRVVIPWKTIEKVPLIIAWDAIIVAEMLRRRKGT
jgi:hypothetical protein